MSVKVIHILSYTPLLAGLLQIESVKDSESRSLSRIYSSGFRRKEKPQLWLSFGQQEIVQNQRLREKRAMERHKYQGDRERTGRNYLPPESALQEWALVGLRHGEGEGG